jgi:hypothetical protein
VRFAAGAKAFRPTDDVDDLIAQRETQNCDGDPAPASEYGLRLFMALVQDGVSGRKSPGCTPWGPIATTRDFGGSLPELGLVRAHNGEGKS